MTTYTEIYHKKLVFWQELNGLKLANDLLFGSKISSHFVQMILLSSMKILKNLTKIREIHTKLSF